jgi:hypothetical protein
MTAEIIRLADRAPKFRKLNAALAEWQWNNDGDLELKAPGYLFTATPLPGGRTRLTITPEAQTLELGADEYKSRVAALLAG